LGKKNKKDRAARLRSLQTIYVEGEGNAASYVRKNLSQETCLLNTPERSEADAILEVMEVSPVPCEMGSPGLCSSITAQLIDAKTNEALWLVSDDHLPMKDVLHPFHGPSEWVVWNLKTTCCKGRPIPAPPKTTDAN
jgi:hypothetical protein